MSGNISSGNISSGNISSGNISSGNVMYEVITQEIRGFIDLIRECHKKICSIYDCDFKVSYKDDKSPLTEADLACNGLICAFLSANYPDVPIISEENKKISFEQRKSYTQAWIVDPIDGTKEFVKKNGEFTVNIGKVVLNQTTNKFEPVMGIVSTPVLNDFYYGSTEGARAVCFNLNLETNQLSTLPMDLDVNLRIKNILTRKNLRIAVSGSHSNDLTEDFITTIYGNGNTRESLEKISKGSSIKLLMVAEQTVDMYPRLAPTSEWDTCAAHAIVKATGGHVIKYDPDKIMSVDDVFKGGELEYNKENILNPYFIVF